MSLAAFLDSYFFYSIAKHEVERVHQTFLARTSNYENSLRARDANRIDHDHRKRFVLDAIKIASQIDRNSFDTFSEVQTKYSPLITNIHVLNAFREIWQSKNKTLMNEFTYLRNACELADVNLRNIQREKNKFARLYSLPRGDGLAFENYISSLLQLQGYNTQSTPKSGDLGASENWCLS